MCCNGSLHAALTYRKWRRRALQQCHAQATTPPATQWRGHCAHTNHQLCRLPSTQILESSCPVESADAVLGFGKSGLDMELSRHAACRLFILQHPEVEARIVDELRGLGLLATPQQPQPRPLEHADLSKLTYLSCAVKVRRLGGLISGDVALPLLCLDAGGGTPAKPCM